MEPVEGLGGAAALLFGGVVVLLIRSWKYALGVAVGFALPGSAWSFYYAYTHSRPTSVLFSMAYSGGLYSFFAGCAGLLAVLGLLFLHRYERLVARQMEDRGQPRFFREGYALTLWAAGSIAVLASSNHLILSLIALETVSFALIVLVGYHWANPRSPEAAIKYLLLSAVATATLVYGLSYVYGISGTLYLHTLKLVDWSAWQNHFLFRLGMALMMVGFLFKLSVFPFHWWAPDVYGGAVPGAAGLAVAFGKLSSALFLGQVLNAIPILPGWQAGLALVAAVSALYGNLMAVTQKSFQRLLGYSSVAHGGYLLLGLLSGSEGLLQGWAYVLAYGLMSLLVFGLGSVDGEPAELERLRGLGYSWPGQGAALALSLVALSGMPPLIGFFAKYGVFVAAFRAGLALPATIALLGALIGYYAYWKPIALLYQSSEHRPPLPLPLLSLSVLLLVLIGVVPLMLWGWMDYLYAIAGYFGR